MLSLYPCVSSLKLHISKVIVILSNLPFLPLMILKLKNIYIFYLVDWLWGTLLIYFISYLVFVVVLSVTLSIYQFTDDMMWKYVVIILFMMIGLRFDRFLRVEICLDFLSIEGENFEKENCRSGPSFRHLWEAGSGQHTRFPLHFQWKKSRNTPEQLTVSSRDPVMMS